MFLIKSGYPKPFGATPLPGGVNFAVFSRNALSVTLCLFAKDNDGIPLFEYKLDPVQNKTGDIWHLFVENLKPGALYAWRVDGPYIPKLGIRFNKNKLLLDPYAKALSGNFEWDVDSALSYKPDSKEKDLSFSDVDNAAKMPKCVVIDDDDFDWKGDRPLNLPLRHCVIYESHVRSLSVHASAQASHPGTYLGVIEQIPYLKSLGITSLELLPVQEFNHHENYRKDPRTGQRLAQYWGYSTIAFFAPKGRYASSGCSGQQVNEFKKMVRELHKNKIEIILDVVFNHTGEGNELGPTFSFRGFDNSIWYMLSKDERFYMNFSGCGNTLNCNHPVVRNFILDCLHYWVVNMHVDGFRFDLGSILGRDRKGNMLENPPVLEQIAEDPILRHTKIIAEAWDAGGAYQVGSFPGGRWAEWNDRYRDDVRRYWRGDENCSAAMATRLTGSSDLYLRDGRKPFHSINYITAHDGFTLRDLVSYIGKHNDRNGENNCDGNNSNYSFNYGIEGATKNQQILSLRLRQQKNFLASLLLSTGTPMLLGGDEFGRSQHGNNNAYCQDNEISWYDWTLPLKNEGLVRFVKKLIILRLSHLTFRRPEFFTGEDKSRNSLPDIVWYSPSGGNVDWSSRAFSARVDGSRAEIVADRDDNDFFIMLNASSDVIYFKIPDLCNKKAWYQVVNTALEPPFDITEAGEELPVGNEKFWALEPHSLGLLISK